ncbi:MAG: zinc-dependent peptidase [Proteobacteria bacterium]|nr:zinc-dependent peptidase [Pseudomonadota bacterium]MDA0926674.1 zinc-dependent peptidase [Pseudomonadota bacterium]
MDTTSIVALGALLLLVIAVIFYVVYWPNIRLRRIERQPFPSEWQSIVERRLPFYRKLPGEQQQRLQNLIKRFLADHNFVGCAGLQITDEIRLTIAAQACLLILNMNGYAYHSLRSILVYPSTFIATREVRDDLGLVSTSHTALLGESWDQGKVVLAWDNVEHGVCNLEDGRNVVLHEFAHQLDSESGAVNGAPLLHTRGAYKSWTHVFQKEFEQLNFLKSHHHASLIDQYGASNPAEFFAVATETFFERPKEMATHHEELYRELRDFYNVEPQLWHQ